MTRTLTFALCLLFGCGAEVKPLDPRDSTLPLETRRYLAASEDGVVVARGRLVVARQELARQQRRDEEPPQGGALTGALEGSHEAMREARVAHAEQEVTVAEVMLELAQAKFDLATAQRAMQHDLAVYELQPLRDRVAAARTSLKEERGKARTTRQKRDGATDAWWKAYGAAAGKAQGTRDYWAGGGARITLRAASKPAAGKAAKAKPATTAKPASGKGKSGDKKKVPTNPF